MKENKGFSLIEMIIAIAIITLVSTGILVSSSYIRYANTKRCVSEINSMLEKVRVLSMSKSKRPFLYIYKYNDDYYMKATAETLIRDEDGTFLGNGSISIVAIDESDVETTVSNVNTLKIGFKKSNGSFDDVSATYYKSIRVAGENGDYTIELIKPTGKHFIK